MEQQIVNILFVVILARSLLQHKATIPRAAPAIKVPVAIPFPFPISVAMACRFVMDSHHVHFFRSTYGRINVCRIKRYHCFMTMFSQLAFFWLSFISPRSLNNLWISMNIHQPTNNLLPIIRKWDKFNNGRLG